MMNRLRNLRQPQAQSKAFHWLLLSCLRTYFRKSLTAINMWNRPLDKALKLFQKQLDGWNQMSQRPLPSVIILFPCDLTMHNSRTTLEMFIIHYRSKRSVFLNRYPFVSLLHEYLHPCLFPFWFIEITKIILYIVSFKWERIVPSCLGTHIKSPNHSHTCAFNF